MRKERDIRGTNPADIKATNYFFLAVDFFAGAAVFFGAAFALAIKTSMVFLLLKKFIMLRYALSAMICFIT